MVRISDFEVIADYLDATSADSLTVNSSTNPSSMVSPSLSDFYLRDGTDMLTLNIVLCDWGVSSWSDKHLSELIQPVLLRAPEIIIGASWGPPADIWNLGAVLLELLDNVRMFDGRPTQTEGTYQTKHHLEEMVALFGRFPPSFLARGNQSIVGEYFNDDGNLRDPIPREPALLENWIGSLQGKDKEDFIKLLKAMMKIVPDDRKTARALLEECWLQDRLNEEI
jgi:serine/threonine-protein kinase SRPK3